MLVIRMQRTGRKGHAMFRLVVQDSRLTPTSGKVVAQIGNYDPHAKTININKDRAAFYLEHGAQPSERVTRLLKLEGVKLPSWVTISPAKERSVRNADKRRSTRPPAPVEEAVPETAPAAAEADTINSEENSSAPNETAEVTASEEPETEAKKETVAETTESASELSDNSATESSTVPDKDQKKGAAA